jgi:hypothetical protein
MMNKYNFLNIEKIIQIFFYIQKHAETKDKLKLIKYLFFADRINIRKHYSFISLDNYIALANGPAASISLNILNKKQREYLSNYADKDLKFLDAIQLINGSTIKIKEMNNDLLSRNETHSIDTVIDIFSPSLSVQDMIAISHDYPEWNRYKEFFDNNMISATPILIDDFFTNPQFENSPALLKHFKKDPLYEVEEYLEEAKLFYKNMIVLNKE